jgi:predicted GTPase
MTDSSIFSLLFTTVYPSVPVFPWLNNNNNKKARAIVSDVAGTTRDTLDAELEKDGRIYKFVDTAGIRRRGKVQYGSEFFMVNRALKVRTCAD